MSTVLLPRLLTIAEYAGEDTAFSGVPICTALTELEWDLKLECHILECAYAPVSQSKRLDIYKSTVLTDPSVT